MKKMYINKLIINKLLEESNSSPRKRSHFLLHTSPFDQIQSLLFGLQPNTRIRAHRHSNKTETINCIKGKLAIFFFDSMGIIDNSIILNSNEIFKFDPTKWHSYLCLETDTIGWEVKEGPYIPEKIEYPEWCPEENDNNFDVFFQKLLCYIDRKGMTI
jgi:cupin fold WbuC family metalloprotein